VSRSIEVQVNGEGRHVTEGSTVSTLLEELELHPRGVAVEYNGEILKRAAFAATRLVAGDQLEIVRFVQGGNAPSSASYGGDEYHPLRSHVFGAEDGASNLSLRGAAAIVPNGQGPLAQLVEQQTLNLRVRGSIPWRLTNGSSDRPPAFQLSRRAALRTFRIEAPGGLRAKVAELAYALDLGSSPSRVGGSSPPFRTTHISEASLL
jgi:sulfur carrier protein